MYVELVEGPPGADEPKGIGRRPFALLALSGEGTEGDDSAEELAVLVPVKIGGSEIFLVDSVSVRDSDGENLGWGSDGLGMYCELSRIPWEVVRDSSKEARSFSVVGSCRAMVQTTYECSRFSPRMRSVPNPPPMCILTLKRSEPPSAWHILITSVYSLEPGALEDMMSGRF